ncbi:MAG: ribosomal protein S18-alanine N-acetyltransferase [Candidatus Helarchaeales archaeon]
MNGKKEVQIRPAKETDMMPAFQIELRSFPIPYTEKFFRQVWEHPGTIVLVAEMDGEIVGFTIGINKGNDFGHVISIAVDPSHQRKGLGQLLLKELCKKLACKKVELEVAESNIVARKFYEKFGFVSEKRLERYYSNGEDAILMRLDIKK